MPHGTIVWSHDRAIGRCWLPSSQQPIDMSDVVEIGAPFRFRWWKK
jgi:hypothetical protein